ncbi:MAG: Asp-tRNA(Asn)/Glu-tRNA(Gln) amidotransferase subunit GatB [Candidatus Pacebacteria bacterium]|nr:Asp-tRNA(Asn)/Glu-tRNA(Gln) amidotransferase subunit GatB [Candidatus Paceibacterota bacterium]
MTEYVPTIGLEIHAELNTRSKMFCGCSNNPDENNANTLICPVCMAHPGTLPVINKEAIRYVLLVGCAVDGVIADFSEFDRKNYFYPDIPKGYQISQYKYPLISGGMINGVAITRIHMEEDTASSAHATDSSLVNFNRAGVPLMELVTEPVIHDAETAVSFARDLRLCLRYIGASNANLEKGEMRIEANISIAPKNGPLGTKVEVKNLNSFKAVEQAIRFEIRRQTEALNAGTSVVQETRGWDENKQKTFSQRAKENSNDYRYFPDPDLPKLSLSDISAFSELTLRESLPTLPWDLRVEYRTEGLREQAIETLVNDIALNHFYRGVCANLHTEKERSLAVNYMTSDLLGLLALPEYSSVDIQTLSTAEFATIVRMIDTEQVSSRGAKEILAVWVAEGGDPEVIAKKIGILQNSSVDELGDIIEKIIATHASVVEDFRAGKEQALQFLVGQGMRLSKGAANPAMLRELLSRKINTH